MTSTTGHSARSAEQLPESWTVTTFEELLAEPVRNGIYKKKEFHGRGQKIVNMGELFAHDFISNQEMKRVELNSREMSKTLLHDGDLLFARRSLVLEGSGKCSLVVNPSEDTTFESSIIRARLDQSKANPHFYYYLWRSPHGRALMSSIATRTAVSGITGSNLVKLKLPLPPLFTQVRIASVLSAYDDLIENNNRRIEILEEMAQAIYREWFINFRFPGHQKVRMVDSQLGPIPEGWTASALNDLVSIKSGFAFKSTTFAKGGRYKLVTIKNVQDGRFMNEPQNSLQDLPPNLPEHCHLETGDILLSLTGNVGRVCFVYGDDYVLNQRVAKLVPKGAGNRGYVYFAFRQLELRERLEAIATGVAQQNLSPVKTGVITTLIPDPETLNRFADFCEPIIEEKLVLFLKNTNLRSTRDLLLPKLISGEVDVEQVETKEIEAELGA